MMANLLTFFFFFFSIIRLGYSGQFYGNLITPNQVNITVFFDTDTLLANITLCGPSSDWFGVGFDASFMNGTYAIVVDATLNAVQERVLGNHDPGTLLPSSLTLLSKSVLNGNRCVIVERTIDGLNSSYYSFSEHNNTIPIVYSIGTSQRFPSRHSVHALTTFSLSEISAPTTTRPPDGETCQYDIKTNYASQLCLNNTPNNEYDGTYHLVACDNNYPYYINSEKQLYVIYGYNYERPNDWYLQSKNIHCICTKNDSFLLNCVENSWYCKQNQNRKYSPASSMTLYMCEDDGGIFPEDAVCNNNTKTLCVSGFGTSLLDGEYTYKGCKNKEPYYKKTNYSNLYIYYNHAFSYWYIGNNISQNTALGICLNNNNNQYLDILSCDQWKIYNGTNWNIYYDILVVNSTCDTLPNNNTTVQPNITESLPISNPNKQSSPDYCCHGTLSTRDEYRCNKLYTEALCTDEEISGRCYWDSDCSNIQSRSILSDTQEVCNCTSSIKNVFYETGSGNRKYLACKQNTNEALCLFRSCEWDCQ